MDDFKRKSFKDYTAWDIGCPFVRRKRKVRRKLIKLLKRKAKRKLKMEDKKKYE